MEVIFIRDKIYEIRGQRVMLDFDLAALYEVPTKVLNQAVKRNADRFPEDFMFRLTDEEWVRMWSQFVTSSGKNGQINIQALDGQQNNIPPNWSHFVTSSPKEGLRSQSVTVSETNSSQIVMSSRKNRGKSYLPYAFTEHGVTMLASVLKSDKAVQLNAIENLLDEKAAQRHWEDRERIGFKKGRITG